MLTKSSNTNTACKYTILLILLMVLTNTPFIFVGISVFSAREYRLIIGLLIIALLIFRNPSFTITDVLSIVLIISLLTLELFYAKSELSNILSYYAVVAFYFLFYLSLKNSYELRREFINIWISMAYFISIGFILLFFLNQFTSFDLNFFGFSQDSSIYGKITNGLKFSFLGATGIKNFGFYSFHRCYGYFVEPVYASFYFIINILIGLKINTDGRYKNWLLLNIIAGMVTFSVAFALSVGVIFLWHLLKRGSIVYIILSLLVLFACIALGIAAIVSDVASTSSHGDRLVRLYNAINILRKSNFTDLMFGHGVTYVGDADRGLSLGFFHVLVERGITGLTLVMTMMILFLRKYTMAFVICFLYLVAAITWYVNYIYWIGVLALWAVSYYSSVADQWKHGAINE